MISYIDDVQTIFQLESIPCIYLHDILRRLLANVCFDTSAMGLSRFVAFRVTFTISAVERNVVAYSHPYI